MATVGGNLCLDTRCIYYNQSEWWRSANAYCLKNRGDTCHVAPQGQRCHAAFSGDLAPALLVLGAEIDIAGAKGQRRIPLSELYVEDGKAHLTLAAGELVVAVHLPAKAPVSAYQKVRTRGAIDFPLAGVAVALTVTGKTIGSLRIALTGTNSRPFLLDGTDAFVGQALDDKLLQAIDRLVQKQVQPMRTTLASANYRRLAAAALARRLTASLFAEACAPELAFRNNGGRFQLDLGRCVEQIGDEDHAHRREMVADQRFPDAPEFAPAGEIGRLVDAERGHPTDMLRLAAGLRQDRQDVLERLLELRHELLALKFLIGVPADLAGDEYDAAGRHADAVGIADRRQPAGRKKHLR